MEYHEGTITLDIEQVDENNKLKYQMNGFPDCCIDAMLKGKGVNLVINKKINKTKLKPCRDCAIDIIEGNKTLSNLITDTRVSFLEPFKEVWEKHSSFIDTKREKL